MSNKANDRTEILVFESTCTTTTAAMHWFPLQQLMANNWISAKENEEREKEKKNGQCVLFYYVWQDIIKNNDSEHTHTKSIRCNF